MTTIDGRSGHRETGNATERSGIEMATQINVLAPDAFDVAQAALVLLMMILAILGIVASVAMA